MTAEAQLSGALPDQAVAWLAPYACRPEASRGRLHDEPEAPGRTCYQRDRDRIVHCSAFRRLKYKTQVFVFHEGDNYRTRLSHSIEVAQIARSMARSLRLNEDLSEALALAHDLGHTPFGHAGEDALDKAMAGHGGFDHNEQTLRILSLLERRYADFDGLNLTWETLEGTVKHNGPLVVEGHDKPVPPSIASLSADFDLGLDLYPSAEAQVAALADDIAYNNHDIDDGLRAGVFDIDDLRPLPLVGPMFEQVMSDHPDLERGRVIHEVVRRLINAMVNDLLTESGRRLSQADPTSADDIRRLGAPVVAFSDAMRDNDRALKAFLFKRMYRHFRVNRMAAKCRRVVAELFEAYKAAPNCLPDEWQLQVASVGPEGSARVIADYIAGMTDRYALEEHRRLFDPHARS